MSLIKDKVNDQQYKTWFKPIELVEIISSTISLRVPSKFFYEWLEEHYLELLDESIKKVIGKNLKIEYVVS